MVLDLKEGRGDRMVVLLLRGAEGGQIDRQWESARSRCWHIMQRGQNREVHAEWKLGFSRENETL